MKSSPRIAALLITLLSASSANAGVTDAVLSVFSNVLPVNVTTDHQSEDDVFEQIFAKENNVTFEDKAVVFTNDDAAEYGTDLETVYARIKANVDRLNIFTDYTHVYVPGELIYKDQIVAVSTSLTDGVYSLSFEDVAEYIELELADGGRFYRVVVTTRQENVVDGNYDITLHLTNPGTADAQLEVYYVKRQNLVGAISWINGIMFPAEDYVKSTRASVENTIARLTALGFDYPIPTPIDEVPWCEMQYDSYTTGCDYSWNKCGSGYSEVSSTSCKLGWWDFGWTGRSRSCQKPTHTTCNMV